MPLYYDKTVVSRLKNLYSSLLFMIYKPRNSNSKDDINIMIEANKQKLREKLGVKKEIIYLQN